MTGGSFVESTPPSTLAAGLYIVRIKTNSMDETRKIIIVK